MRTMSKEQPTNRKKAVSANQSTDTPPDGAVEKETSFDFAHLTDEQLQALLQAAQAEFLERQRKYTRECSIEGIRRSGYDSRANKVTVYHITWDREEEWTKRTILTTLPKDEATSTFGSFSARVGQIIELHFRRKSSTRSLYWYVVTADGSLERVAYVRDSEQTAVVEEYLAGEMTLMELLEAVRGEPSF